MQEERSNVVKFRARPKSPPPPPPKPKKPKSRSGPGEPAINWSRAPKAIALIIAFSLAMWLVGLLANWVGGIGMK